MNISIEYDDDNGHGGGYGTLHRTGCKNLIDSEEVGEFLDRSEAAVGAAELTGWDDPHWRFAPCVKLP